MKTYQDFLEVGQTDEARMEFVRSAINEYRGSKSYREAVAAEQYYRRHNSTIEQYQKLLYTITGEAVPDNYSANWKLTHGFFKTFVIQEVQHLLGNGVRWAKDDTAAKLGHDFDTRLQEAAKQAVIGACSFGFFNLDHVDVFSATEFVPLFDEEDGALKAGVRFWQIDSTKPLRATLYELDGYTDYIWRKRKDANGEILHDKRPYILKLSQSEADGTKIYDFENYPSFPIVPLWANPEHESELTGIRSQIDCYDLIASGFANDVDDASLIFWTIQNAGGMDDIDLAKFVERMKTLKAAVVEQDGATAESHTIDVPYESREALLDRLQADLYRDAMALDIPNIASGAITATQITASYKPLDSKCDDLEYCILDWLEKILALAGIEDESPTFTRDYIVNRQEEIQSIIAAAPYLSENYVTTKVLAVFGDGDKAEEILKEMSEEAADKMKAEDIPEETSVEEQTEESYGLRA